MKKITLFLTLLITVASCSKPSLDAPSPARVSYFSKVQRFTDGRTPGVDTIWTLQLFNQQMRDSFARYDGYVYQRSASFTEVGVIWSK